MNPCSDNVSNKFIDFEFGEDKVFGRYQIYTAIQGVKGEIRSLTLKNFDVVQVVETDKGLDVKVEFWTTHQQNPFIFRLFGFDIFSFGKGILIRRYKTFHVDPSGRTILIDSGDVVGTSIPGA